MYEEDDVKGVEYALLYLNSIAADMGNAGRDLQSYIACIYIGDFERRVILETRVEKPLMFSQWSDQVRSRYI